jgi:hypothetical protein
MASHDNEGEDFSSSSGFFDLLSQLSNEVAASITGTDYPQFKKLPTELRLKI